MIDVCKRLVWLNHRPISFAGRGYLADVYSAVARGNLVLRASRQVEKSTLLANFIAVTAAQYPGIQLLFVCPRQEQASMFSSVRLLPTIKQSPLLKRALLGGDSRLQVMNCTFANGSRLFVRAAFHSADPVRGLSADVLLVDEFQDLSGGELPVLQETLSHSSRAQTIITGTPKLIDNHLEGVFSQSTACEWQVTCRDCGKANILDEHVLSPAGLACAQCSRALDATEGSWAPRNPASSWGAGYWLNHFMVPWLNTDDLLARQAVYDPARFRNECVGLPTALGDHLITRQDIEACCLETPMANSLDDVHPAYHDFLVAGIDWGGGSRSATVLVIGYITSDLTFTVVRMDRLRAREDPDRILQEIDTRCRAFAVQ